MSETEPGFNPYNPSGQGPSKLTKLITILLTAGFVVALIGNQYRNASEHCDELARTYGVEYSLAFDFAPPFFQCKTQDPQLPEGTQA